MKPTDGHAHGHDEVHPAAELHNEGVLHEHTDVNIRAVIAFAVALIVVAAIVHVAMYLLFGFFERDAAKNDPVVSPVAAPGVVMPRTTAASPFFGAAAGPRLATDEPRMLNTLHARENLELHGYAWVDQQGGVTRIPIDQAEKLLLQRGLPSRQTEQADPSLGTHAQAVGEASGGRDIPVVKQAAGSGQPGTGGEQPGPGAQPGSGSSEQPASAQPGQAGGGAATAQPKKPGGGE